MKSTVVQNKTRSTPWWKIKWVQPHSVKQNQHGVLLENKTHSGKQNHLSKKITLSVKQK